MESKINGGMNWSLNELKQLADDKNSCVHFERKRRHIAIHPFQLNDLNKALHETLRSLINFYDSELKGLLLSYKNPKLLSSLGSILYDSHFIHIDIEADFYVFKPEIGCVLNGVINKQATNHIGVLVHKAFNVSIPINENDIAWQNHELYVGGKVEFTITHVDFKGKLPFIKGKLLSESTQTADEDFEPDFSPIKSNSQTVNGEDSEHRINTESKKDTAPKRINFLTSVLNQSSESSSDEEIVTKKKKSPESKSKTSKEILKDSKKKVNCAVEDKVDVASTSKAKYSNNDEDDTSDEEITTQSDKKKLKSPKIVVNSQNDEADEVEVAIKKRKKLQNDESSDDEILPTPVPTVDRKPRIIHDRVLNENERNIKIERTSVKTSKRRSIFAHDISDSDDDMDNGRNYLTQTSAPAITENDREEKVKKAHSNGLKSPDPVETNDDSQEEENEEKSTIFIKKKSSKSKKKKVDLSDDDTDDKEYIKNSILHSSTPDKITKSQDDSPKSKVTKESVKNYADSKSNGQEDDSNDSTSTSDLDYERKKEKRIKKKLKKLASEKVGDHAFIDSSMPPPSRPLAKIEKEYSTTSPKKSRKNHEKSFESGDDSSDSSPKKTKIKKHEAILFGNVKIKREPDASDVESSSSNKVERKHKNIIVNGNDALVKPEPINIKTEEKNKIVKIKRKHKESRKNDSSVKCESDSSESERSFSVPKKKIRTMFSE